MAPNTKNVVEELENRAIAKGLPRGSDDFEDYVQPRNIPPMVVEHVLNTVQPKIGKKPGTLEYITDELKIVTNLNGDVVTLHPRTSAKGKK